MIFCDSTSTGAHHRLLVSNAFSRSIKIPIESQVKIISPSAESRKFGFMAHSRGTAETCHILILTSKHHKNV